MSAPCTPTGTRDCLDACNRSVPIPHRRELSFGLDAYSCSTRGTRSLSMSSTSVTDSSSVHTRSVNLYDLIDEEFVVNCGSFSGDRSGMDERMTKRNGHNCATSPRLGHRRRKSILDMIDRIGTSPEDDDHSVMTMRSYPRGVYVVPPKHRETASSANVVAFVSSEAYNQW
eukprot:CAMPEP_0168184140 /NCGR_PEP_ID=MMETSP0139_2-20121125/13045_1 /TAXON_ID=44445 /ORGANISM="Pseudo-nitzschia australis, Strain 10249 10 AB" /LENGTH=170 /DNA_ID=CAMNT_0008105671 /DNA_START=338 /DNA_END=850 /DNA_ORIENTATION=+